MTDFSSTVPLLLVVIIVFEVVDFDCSDSIESVESLPITEENTKPASEWRRLVFTVAVVALEIAVGVVNDEDDDKEMEDEGTMEKAEDTEGY